MALCEQHTVVTVHWCSVVTDRSASRLLLLCGYKEIWHSWEEHTSIKWKACIYPASSLSLNSKFVRAMNQLHFNFIWRNQIFHSIKDEGCLKAIVFESMNATLKLNRLKQHSYNESKCVAHFGLFSIVGKKDLDRTCKLCKLCCKKLKYFANFTNMRPHLTCYHPVLKEVE